MRTLLLTFLLVLFVGCDQSEPAPLQPISIDLQGYYDNTFARVELDGEVLFEGHVTTGQILAIAAQIPTTVTAGEHTLAVGVAGKVFESFTFATDSVAAIGVGYSAQREDLTFITTPDRFGYR